MALKSIEGGKGKPRPKRERVVCHKCRGHFGIEVAATVVQVRSHVEFDERGRLVGGSKAWACMHCLMRGEWTPLG